MSAYPTSLPWHQGLQWCHTSASCCDHSRLCLPSQLPHGRAAFGHCKPRTDEPGRCGIGSKWEHWTSPQVQIHSQHVIDVIQSRNSWRRLRPIISLHPIHPQFIPAHLCPWFTKRLQAGKSKHVPPSARAWGPESRSPSAPPLLQTPKLPGQRRSRREGN